MNTVSQHLQRVGDKQFVFIIGAPRSGTTWLHRMLSAHAMVASVAPELTLFSKYLAPGADHFKRETYHRDRGDWKQGLPVLYTQEEFDGALRSIVGDVYGRVLAMNPGASHIIDKHPHYARTVDLIDHLLPTSRFVHIIRDGRDVAVSTMSTHRRLGHGQGDIYNASRVWHECITQARASGAKLGPDRYLEVRYEDLMADPVARLSPVFRFCGLPATVEEVSRITAEYDIERKQLSKGEPRGAKVAEAWRQKLDLKQRYLMDRYVGHLLKELGYAVPGWWANDRTEALRVLFWPTLWKMRESYRSVRRIWKEPIAKKIGRS